MAGSDPAARLALAITRAREVGSKHPTRPSYVTWATVLETKVDDTADFMRLLHHLTELPKRTRTLIEATGRDDLHFIDDKLVIVQSVLTFSGIVEPWRNSAVKLDEPLVLALKAASAIFASERRLAATEEAQLTALLGDIGELLESVKLATDIDPYLRDFLMENLSDMDMLIRRYWLLGDKALAAINDRAVGGLMRLYTENPDIAKTEHVKRFGRIVAATALALGIANGAYQLESNIAHLISTPAVSVSSTQQVNHQPAPESPRVANKDLQ